MAVSATYANEKLPMTNQDIQAIVDEVLAPLLEADGGSVEIIDAGDECVKLKLTGSASTCTGGRFTQVGVIEPLLRTVLGPKVRIEVQKGVPSPFRVTK